MLFNGGSNVNTGKGEEKKGGKKNLMVKVKLHGFE